MNLRQKLIDPVLYRLGYQHHSDVIQSVTTWTTEDVGGKVTGLLVFPGFDNERVHVEFEGTVFDGYADDEDPDPETQCTVCGSDTATVRCCGWPKDDERQDYNR